MNRALSLVEEAGGTFTFRPVFPRSFAEPTQQALVAAASTVTTGEITASPHSVSFTVVPQPAASEIGGISRRLQEAVVDAVGGPISVEHQYMVPPATRTETKSTAQNIVRVTTYDDRTVSVRWTDQGSVGAHLASSLRRLGFVATATDDINRLVRQLGPADDAEKVVASVFTAAYQANPTTRFETNQSALPGPEPTSVSYAPRRPYDGYRPRLESLDQVTTSDTTETI